MGQGVGVPPSISIHESELEAAHEFAFLGSTITDSLSLETEINRCIGMAAITLSRLTKKSLNKQQSHRAHENTGVWILDPALPAREETQQLSYALLETHPWHLLEKQGDKQRTMFTLLKQRRMRWLVHVWRMEDGSTPKDRLHGELVTGTGRPQLRYRDIFKRNLKALGINTNTWEAASADRTTWKQDVKKGLSLSLFGENLTQQAEEQRSRRKTQLHADRPATTFTCGQCHRDRPLPHWSPPPHQTMLRQTKPDAELHGLTRPTEAY